MSDADLRQEIKDFERICHERDERIDYLSTLIDTRNEQITELKEYIFGMLWLVKELRAKAGEKQ